MNKAPIKLIYEIFMLLLAILSVSLLWADTSNRVYALIDWSVWFIFFMDVLIRFIRADSKWQYIRSNPLDIIAAIPLDALFRFARIARLIRLLRAFALASRMIDFKQFFIIFNQNGLNRVVSVAIVMLFLASIPIYFIEPHIKSYGDALWWSVVTTTTVGYGDISPVTVPGRVIATFLMVFGIGMIGMITGSITTYFLKAHERMEPDIEFIQNQLSRYDHLTPQEIDTLIVMLEKRKDNLAEKKEQPSS
ncbi:potassium channel family protein [Marinicrinis sediminis]|uniref:Potassium channel family protein n=1 Tax=Marinicrinis sediminis TaxID=1652465 RepID=A0ABW5R9M7_9BACL